MSRKRPRHLSPQEAALWDRVVRSATRLNAPAAPVSTAAEALPPAAAGPLPAASRSELRSTAWTPDEPAPRPAPSRATRDRAPAAVAAAAAPPLDKRRFERLRRGKLAPEARLDLHGMSRDRAHAALVPFVLSAQARGLRLVLVITGKGRPDTSDAVIPEWHGILRHSLPHWLAAPPLTGRVLAILPAHARHGGAGAVYLYLRRGAA